MLLLLGAQNKDFVVIVVVAEVGDLSLLLIIDRVNLVVNLILTELIDFTNQLCCH